MAEHWVHKHRGTLKSIIRVGFGLVWLVDGLFKFSPGMPANITQMIQSAGQNNPSWLLPWFNFWFGVVGQHPTFWVYFTGACEVLLGLGLLFGALRKITYIMGMMLSLFIWAVPEGLGGPYGPSSTDIGTGIIYAFVFLALMMINAGYGPSRWSVDYYLEKRLKWWHKLAEFD